MWYGIGYDFGGTNGTPDNNPMEDVPFHGTFVAGVADAVTNNKIGVAGMGFKSKIIAVKVSEADITDANGEPYIVYGYDGIKYAADKGAKVINCSWGGNGYSNLEQEVIDYATSEGALVVAAAGNDNSSEDFYPAGYQNVVAVAATDANDQRAFYSNFGPNIDVSAPGSDITSTWQPDTYESGYQGTSFSAPLVSGIAALVFSRFPNYTPQQVAEQIRVNCDNIDAKNPSYKYELGAGRVNAYKAVSDTNSVSVRAVDVKFSDAAPGGNGDGILQPGETISVGINFRNYLKPVSNLLVSLQSMSSYCTIQNGTVNLGSLGTLDSTNNYSAEFTFTLSKSLPVDVQLPFLLNYSGTFYSDFQAINTEANRSYSTQKNNTVSLTITSKGALGFNDYPNDLEGDGFTFDGGPNLMFEGALMMGTSATHLSDEARGPASDSGQDSSFQIVSPFKLSVPGSSADEEGTAEFNDNGSGSSKLGVDIKLHTYTYTAAPDDSFIIMNYNIINRSGSDIYNLYTGLFFDWDMVEGSGDNDITAYDSTGELGYAYHLGGNPNTWVGTALISSNEYGYWGILNPGGDAGFQIYDGFTNNEKWEALSSGIGKSYAGPGDISEVTSGGPFNIKAGDSLNVAFAIAGGNGLTDLRTAIAAARAKYLVIIGDTTSNNPIPTTYALKQNYPNPFDTHTNTTIDYFIPQSEKNGVNVKLIVYDALGNELTTLDSGTKMPGEHIVTFKAAKYASGVYIYRLKAGNFVQAKKMLLLK
jgi:serine protease